MRGIAPTLPQFSTSTSHHVFFLASPHFDSSFMGIIFSTFRKSRGAHTSPPSPFEPLLNDALRDYAKQTGKRLEHHPFTKKLKKCDSVDSITALLQDYQEHAKAFRKFRGDHGKVMRPMKRAVYFLFTLSSSTVLGEAVALVCPNSFIPMHLL